MTDADHISYEATIDDPGDVHAAVEDEHAALPAGREERPARPVQVRRVRDRADVRAPAEGADQMRDRRPDSPPRLSGSSSLDAGAGPARPQRRTAASPRSGSAPARSRGSRRARRTAIPISRATGPTPRLRRSSGCGQHAAGADRGSRRASTRRTRPRRSKRATAPSDPNRSAPPVGGECARARMPNRRISSCSGAPAAARSAATTAFWLDPGRQRAARRRPAAQLDHHRSAERPHSAADDRGASSGSRRGERRDASAGRRVRSSELRPLGERCIMSFGNNAGPPMLPNYFYNNNYTIVQIEGHRHDPDRDGP